MEIRQNNKVFVDGQRVIAKIDEVEVVGRIFTNSNRWYILHNDPRKIGSIFHTMHGYLYSWVFNNTLGSDVILLDDASHLKDLKINKQLQDFFKDRIDLKYLRRNDIMKNVVSLFLSKENDINYEENVDLRYGFIKYKNSKGIITELKFGRFLSTYISEVKKVLDIDISISDKTLELYHNDYITLQKSSLLRVELLKGEDILKAYTSENHSVSNNSRLSESCMNNNLEFLEIYTKSDSVSLLTVSINDGFIGRALIWRATNGNTYMDEVYGGEEWVYSLFTSIAKKEGYKSIDSDKIFVNVNTDGIEEFPYLDNFMYMSKDGKFLSTSPTDDLYEQRVLRSTEGEILDQDDI